MDHERAAELLGAYALDAVEPDEAAAVDRHLAACSRCRDELDGHREVAAALVPFAVAVPDRVWDSIATATRPAIVVPIRPAAGATADDGARGRRLVAFAAAVTLALGAGALLSDVRRSAVVDELQARAAVADAATATFADPASRRVDLASADGTVVLRAAVRPDGTGYVVGDGLPRLDADMTYQAWAIGAAGPTDAGVLGSDPKTERIVVQDSGVTTLAVTRERRGGAAKPTSPPLAQGSLPTE